MQPNYNSTKVCFAYFGVYSGVAPDKEKPWFPHYGIARSEQAETLQASRKVTPKVFREQAAWRTTPFWVTEGKPGRTRSASLLECGHKCR